MSKTRTNRSAAKRFKRSGNGKLIHNKSNKSHILTKKSTKRKRSLRRPVVTDKSTEKSMNRIMPYL